MQLAGVVEVMAPLPPISPQTIPKWLRWWWTTTGGDQIHWETDNLTHCFVMRISSHSLRFQSLCNFLFFWVYYSWSEIIVNLDVFKSNIQVTTLNKAPMGNFSRFFIISPSSIAGLSKTQLKCNVRATLFYNGEKREIRLRFHENPAFYPSKKTFFNFKLKIV